MFIAPGFEVRSQVTSGGTVAYAVPQPEFWPPAADAETTLVFIHGFGAGSSAYEWSKVYPAFATDCRVVAPDLPGWGRSIEPEQAYSPDGYEGAIADFLAQVCPGPTWVVASSLAAAYAVRVAIRHRDRIQGLILVAPAGLKDFGDSVSPEILQQVLRLPGLDALLYRGAIATAPSITSFLETRQFADPRRIAPEMVAAYLASAQQPHAEAAALAFLRGDLSVDLALDLPHLTVPTALLWGEAAQFTDVDLGRRLAALAPAAVKQFQILPGVGLTPQLEQPATTIAAIRRSLKILACP